VQGDPEMSGNIGIKLDVDAKAADSDEILRGKAETQVDTVLRMIGKLTAERLWNQFAASLNDSDACKMAFMKEAGDDMVENTPAAHRAEVEKSIFEQLRTQRAGKVAQN
jgi:hypothetical protein